MHTPHFKMLEREVRNLSVLLPKKKSIYGKYSLLMIRRMLAFRLLSHAALETYFEGVSSEFLSRTYTTWTKEFKANEFLVALCFRFARCGDLKENVFLELQKGNVRRLVEKAHDWHSKTIITNHGVREDNIRALFVPYGPTIFAMLFPLCVHLDPYAVIRGEYAHKSPSTMTVPDPDDERQAIRNVLNHVRHVDESLSRLISSLA